MKSVERGKVPKSMHWSQTMKNKSGKRSTIGDMAMMNKLRKSKIGSVSDRARRMRGA